MKSSKGHKEYLVGFFDILGFENRLNVLGLNGMLEKYESLIDIVNTNNKRHDELKKRKLHGAFWTANGTIRISYEIRGAYASDSIIVWAKRELGGEGMRFPDGTFGSPPILCDDFLNVCNELICRSLEMGLPLRGALSMGKAFIDEERNIYLGMPFVEAARLEKGQMFIGASPCKSFNEQPILPHLILPYKSHLKEKAKNETGGSVLDWPRHWRETRETDALEKVISLQKQAGGTNLPETVREKYENTLKLINFSKDNSKYWEAIKAGNEPIYG